MLFLLAFFLRRIVFGADDAGEPASGGALPG